MPKEPELPDFVRDLEIVQSLERCKHPTDELMPPEVQEASTTQQDGTEGVTL